MKKKAELKPLLDFLTTTGREVILDYVEPNSCIISTAVAINFLNRYGYKAEPLTASIVIYNPPVVKWAKENGRVPTREEQDKFNGWIRGIGYGNAPSKNNWGGHLICYVQNNFVDMSLDQGTNPAKQIILQPIHIEATFVDKTKILNGEQKLSLQVNGSVLLYELYKNDHAYRTSSAWNASELIDQVTDLLELKWKRQ